MDTIAVNEMLTIFEERNCVWTEFLVMISEISCQSSILLVNIENAIVNCLRPSMNWNVT